jgi:hypothetical protein
MISYIGTPRLDAVGRKILMPCIEKLAAQQTGGMALFRAFCQNCYDVNRRLLL